LSPEEKQPKPEDSAGASLALSIGSIVLAELFIYSGIEAIRKPSPAETLSIIIYAVFAVGCTIGASLEWQRFHRERDKHQS